MNETQAYIHMGSNVLGKCKVEEPEIGKTIEVNKEKHEILSIASIEGETHIMISESPQRPAETIVASAVWHLGKLYTGERHYDCIKRAVAETNVKPVIGEQGFVTSLGRYLNRYESAKFVKETGQELNGQHPFDGETLYSENLW